MVPIENSHSRIETSKDKADQDIGNDSKYKNQSDCNPEDTKN
jgi:hypothetical protein